MNQQAHMIGSITEFNSSRDDWNVYFERLEQFLEVNDIPEQKQSSFLISVIGSDAYKSLRDLCHPALPKDKPFAFLCELLRKQFSPQVSIFRERAKFYNVRQEGYESVTQWYGKLKRLSVDCKFGENLEAILLDKFITGLRPGQVLDRLCEENETLQLEQAWDIAINKECAAKDNAYTPVQPYSLPRGCFPPPATSSCLFGGQPVKPLAPTNCFAAPAVGFKPQALGLDGGGLFGSSNAAFGAAAPKLQLQQAEPQQLEEAACCGLDSPVPEVEIDGLPAGVNRADGTQARGRGGRIRIRRRGGARRAAAGDNADKQSVDGER